MAYEIPSVEPDIVTKGDTCKFKIWLDDFKPEDGWVLSYAFVNASSQLEVTASDNGDGYHLVSVAEITCDAGEYKFQGYVTKDSERHTVRRGSTTVRADFASEVSGIDGRGKWTQFVETLEDAIVAMTAGEITTANISHNGRNRTYRTVSELREALSMARVEAYREEQRDKLAAGGLAGSRIRLRF